MDVYYKQEPIKNGESIRVFHGCNLETAINACINGLSGQVRVPRKYSYENCMNPKGLFVTTDFEVIASGAIDCPNCGEKLEFDLSDLEDCDCGCCDE
jgi:hypothetical protein